jgi:hypothetical protein
MSAARRSTSPTPAPRRRSRARWSAPRPSTLNANLTSCVDDRQLDTFTWCWPACPSRPARRPATTPTVTAAGPTRPSRPTRCRPARSGACARCSLLSLPPSGRRKPAPSTAPPASARPTAADAQALRDQVGNTFPSGRSYADEMQNFANWFTYYRKRKLMLGAAMGKVLENLTGLRMGVVRVQQPQRGDDVRRRLHHGVDQPAGGGRQVLRDPTAAAARRRTRPWQAHREPVRHQHGIIQYACQRNSAFIMTDGFANATAVAPPAYRRRPPTAGAPYRRSTPARRWPTSALSTTRTTAQTDLAGRARCRWATRRG